MRRLLLVALSFFLLAATPGQVVDDLEANGFYIEPGSNASEQVVSDAVFEARAQGGRLYLVVLSEEPPGGAPTFSDSVLDELGEGYVVTVAPETVGFAGDGSFWSADEMNTAIEASLSGATDDDVVGRFIAELTGSAVVTPPDDGEPASGGGISGWVVLIVIGVVVGGIFLMIRRSSRRNRERQRERLEKVKSMAKGKLDELANDIIELEDEVQLSGNSDVEGHYQRASAAYTQALQDTDDARSPEAMVEVIRELDMAIWELDAAEALLDGKPVPEKPKPPEEKPLPQSASESPQPDPADLDVGRRPQRQSSYTGGEIMSVLAAIMAMSGRRGPGGIRPGGFGGPMGGGGRIGGGGRRMGGGGGRMRGGGRRG